MYTRQQAAGHTNCQFRVSPSYLLLKAPKVAYRGQMGPFSPSSISSYSIGHPRSGVDRGFLSKCLIPGRYDYGALSLYIIRHLTFRCTTMHHHAPPCTTNQLLQVSTGTSYYREVNKEIPSSTRAMNA